MNNKSKNDFHQINALRSIAYLCHASGLAVKKDERKSEFKVFVNDKPFLIREIYNPLKEDSSEGIQVLSESAMPLEKAVGELERNKKWKQVIYLSDSPAQCWLRFVSLYTLIEAAGGLVKNEEDKYLVIFRRGKWDLPKGKLDYDETPEQAAVREVEEECGIGQLRILKALPATFHTYPEGGKRILKNTLVPDGFRRQT